MKKAFIDQILLGLFLFVVLIILGATVNDNMQARDKYYNLKKITDNSVLTLAKYYVNVEENTSNAENVYYQMLLKTKLGNEVKDTIIYTWDFASEPNSVTAEITNYIEETFWFKFLGLASFNLKASSKATITLLDLPTATSAYSNGIAPFAVNYRDFIIGDSLDITYALTADWQYSDKNTFYPILTNCDCDCDFILSNKFDFSSLGFDVDSCNATSSACTSHGESEFTQYANDLYDFFYSNQSIDFDNGITSAPLCLIGTYLGNTTSTWGTQINSLSSGIYDIIGNTGQNLPLDMDIITLGEDAKANGIVRVRITNYDFVTTSNPDNRYLTLNTSIIPAQTKKIELVD